MPPEMDDFGVHTSRLETKEVENGRQRKKKISIRDPNKERIGRQKKKEFSAETLVKTGNICNLVD